MGYYKIHPLGALIRVESLIRTSSLSAIEIWKLIEVNVSTYEYSTSKGWKIWDESINDTSVIFEVEVDLKSMFDEFAH